MTDSLKNLASSVDWSKMVSGADARNAVIGSALGGLLLGGAGLAAERDPEESKYAPVGDALTGALLGGVAGYAVPKGLELFRNSGTLAPDDDRLPASSTGAGAAALEGLGVGTAVGGGLALPAAWRALGKMRDDRDRFYAMPDYMRKVLYGTDKMPRRGIKELLHEIGNEAVVDVKPGKSALGTGLRRWLANLTNGGKHYAPRTWGDNVLLRPFGTLRPISTRSRIIGRAGKYGVAGAGLGYALYKLFGPSAKDNFKN